MGLVSTLETKPRKRVLLLAHCFDASSSMEARLSWFRALYAARSYDTTVISAMHVADDLDRLPVSLRRHLHVVTVPSSRLEQILKWPPGGFYFAYRLWHRRVFRLMQQMHADRPFDLVHQVSYCGYREPGNGWRLGIPFVWGPIGGTQNMPWRFFGQLGLTGMLLEGARNCINRWQLKFSSRVCQALQASAQVFSANREVQQDFRDSCNFETNCQLETGLSDISEEIPACRDTSLPLRILWAGRLECWKAMPLLLKALANLPADVRYELRVVGSGSREKSWKRQVRRLGLEDHVKWLGWPDYDGRDEHYRWADVFAFTSLRDTSGTGLLESLAVGVPIVGLNHQGARDIMTKDCAIKIPVESPRQVVSQMRDAIVQLARDPEQLQQLSIGAIDRAREYHWDRLAEQMDHTYSDLLQETSNHGQSEQTCGNKKKLSLRTVVASVGP